MRCKPWSLFGLIACLALVSPASLAREAGEQRAEQLFWQAEKHYQRGEFAEALAGYAEAYQALALPAFLFNMAQCHRKLGQYERAVFFYQAYLRDAPRATNRDLVLELKAECSRKLDLQRAAARDLNKTVDRRPAERDPAVEGVARAIREPPPPTVSDDPPVYRKWWFWTAVGGAVVAGVVAGAVIGTRPDGPRLSTGSLGRLDLRSQ